MSDSLYDRDVLVWSEQQAALLQQLAAGERPNAAVDWPNVIEELEAVGRSELRRADARRAFAPSMRQRIGLADLYTEVLDQVRVRTDDSGEPRPLPEACPLTLDDMLAGS